MGYLIVIGIPIIMLIIAVVCAIAVTAFVNSFGESGTID
ncbi:hypothetical protein GGE24_003273 [Bradyrhizobium centrosematis]|nr:hypothetical protein [Bradyrhizobium centrosematis]MCS3773961.1 hypothetical protein [Bradyrhizobium centrosematis]